ncbi:FAD-binding domain-containing protein [Halomonas denitrificans]|nr:deoxyribodipyrimidine photo-lyase [Halomonas denitrificans]
MSGPVQLVWFKRDLRVDDHAPLAAAAEHGPVLPVYVVEPELWRQPDAALRHQQFIAEALVDLDRSLRRIGQGLVVRVGNVIDVFEALHREFDVTVIRAHEETGNGWSFDRDRKVRAWAAERGIELHETPQFGVTRGLTERAGWAGRWEAFMGAKRTAPPERLPRVLDIPEVTPERIVAFFAEAPAFDRTPCPQRQTGGLVAGQETLDDFLDRRGEAYRGGISSPLSAAAACSRLSAHIAYGTLSMRCIVQQARARRVTAREQGEKRWAASLNQFDQRLHWHCHFIQKLEQRPAIEFENVHRGFDGMREDDFDVERFAAWKAGRTGYPLIDACMRWVTATGWLNFRMRALLMSFAGYHLWLHWREPALHLARMFTDYEPGIHFNQCQMQNGTTGINTLRIYNPVKQARDQDPEGAFVRRWVPELARIPAEAIFEPWTLGERDRAALGAAAYPLPIVDHVEAARDARARITEYRRRDGFRVEADRIQHQLGSRRSGLKPQRRKRRSGADRRQRNLF